jgi:mannose-6-phosphate isomerase-like protein (cupin superfamily)
MVSIDWVTPARHVPKPWGHEEHFAFALGLYCGKTLHISAGHALSLQLHERKDETIAIYAGRLKLEIGPTPAHLDHIELHPGDTVHIPPGTVHRLTALEDTIVMEASTTELDDVIRLEDRYGRGKVQTLPSRLASDVAAQSNQSNKHDADIDPNATSVTFTEDGQRDEGQVAIDRLAGTQGS